ncbi:type II toxin-antitoxin system PemK/MazF family toxin [Williamsia soli]|uniref:type II toxin-antitoxin system PemK/MazF family toxin n=1 Tax=Williamsia soli TaxID=364929 RepID=UPI001A9FA2FD|nr:type II toxin-antitoxin system PemK/MazF family toxin [Williamsia soli]
MAGKFTSLAMSLVRQHGPRLFREMTKSSSAPSQRPAPRAPSRSAPTGNRARRIDYSPALDGAADPGEIVWTWVEFEEDAGQGKDRPVLVVGREGATVLGLMLSSQGHRRDDSNWVSIGTGDWDREHRESFVRLDRILDIPENGIRREGAILPRGQFDRVADVLRRSYNWQ